MDPLQLGVVLHVVVLGEAVKKCSSMRSWSIMWGLLQKLFPMLCLRKNAIIGNTLGGFVGVSVYNLFLLMGFQDTREFPTIRTA